MNVRRWLIEAAGGSFLLLAFLGGLMFQCLDTVSDDYQVFYLTGIALKILLFFCMRYAESQPDLFLNHIETALVNMFCKSTIEYNPIEK